MWHRTQESGKTKAELFSQFGVTFTKTSNDRECGWLAVKELLLGDTGGVKLKFFPTCTEIIACLPQLTVDKLRPTDCANEPHEITHAPDALRGFAIFHTRPAGSEFSASRRLWSSDMWEDYLSADTAGRQYLKKKYGEPN
jgi:phage terminase large subunit